MLIRTYTETVLFPQTYILLGGKIKLSSFLVFSGFESQSTVVPLVRVNG